jgi:hypothetical protein
MLKLIILFVFVTTTLAHNGFFEWWDLVRLINEK